MASWIRIASWVLVVFAAPGLIYSLVVLDWFGVLLNAAFLAIGVLDLRNVARVKSDPARGWRGMIPTQAALGVVIWISLLFFAEKAVEPVYWDQAREIVEGLAGGRVPEYQWRDAVARSQSVLQWGVILGGGIIFLAQLNVCRKIHARARSAVPPPLPAASKLKKR